MDRRRRPFLLKRWIFRLIRKDPDAVVVSFATGDATLVEKMAAEVRRLVPDRRHFLVPPQEGSVWAIYRRLRRQFRHYRIGLAPVLLTSEPNALRRAAFLLAPRKILAYNIALERHHLQLRTWIASLLFLRGAPLDRIWLRPRWLWPWKKDRSVYPVATRAIAGRPLAPERQRIAVLSPYFPYPLSHGGAVRIFHTLREAAREFDVFLFAFEEGEEPADVRQVAEFCARVVLVKKPRYREPRWSTLLPPEVHEYRSDAMRQAIKQTRREFGIEAMQVEYTFLASYGGDILVEHDVTFDLFGQVARRKRSISACWDYWRWRRFELLAVRHFPRVVVMSEKDRQLLGPPAVVVENGVDLERFRPSPERPGSRLLFIGSFRHFPNVEAYRFFTREVWPLLPDHLTLTVVAGPDYELHCRGFVPPEDRRIKVVGFVADVRPLYVDANIVVAPTTVSAGTNVKVLEAIAMERVVVSTTTGCAGIGLVHGESAWIADTPQDFAAGVRWMAESPEERGRIARAARHHAERHFDWKALGEKQRALIREILTPRAS